MAEAGRLPLNIRMLIEGEEEVGSKGLTKFLTAEPDRTRADAVLVTDVNMVAPGYPSVDTALRGIVHAEIRVRTLQKDLPQRTLWRRGRRTRSRPSGTCSSSSRDRTA